MEGTRVTRVASCTVHAERAHAGRQEAQHETQRGAGTSGVRGPVLVRTPGIYGACLWRRKGLHPLP